MRANTSTISLTWPSQLLHTEHTMGPEAARDSWPTYVMRGMIGKNLDKLVPDVVDEVTAAFDEYIPCGDKGPCHWPLLPVHVFTLSSAQTGSLCQRWTLSRRLFAGRAIHS